MANYLSKEGWPGLFLHPVQYERAKEAGLFTTLEDGREVYDDWLFGRGVVHIVNQIPTKDLR